MSQPQFSLGSAFTWTNGKHNEYWMYHTQHILQECLNQASNIFKHAADYYFLILNFWKDKSLDRHSTLGYYFVVSKEKIDKQTTCFLCNISTKLLYMAQDSKI